MSSFRKTIRVFRLQEGSIRVPIYSPRGCARPDAGAHIGGMHACRHPRPDVVADARWHPPSRWLWCRWCPRGGDPMSRHYEMKIVPSTVRAAKARKAAISRTRQYLAAHPEIEEQAVAVGLRVMDVTDVDEVTIRRRRAAAYGKCRVSTVEVPTPKRVMDDLLERGTDAAIEIMNALLAESEPLRAAAAGAYWTYITQALDAAPASARLDPTVDVAELIHVEFMYGLADYLRLAEVLFDIRDFNALMSELLEEVACGA